MRSFIEACKQTRRVVESEPIKSRIKREIYHPDITFDPIKEEDKCFEEYIRLKSVTFYHPGKPL